MKSVFAAQRIARACCCAAVSILVLGAGPSAAQQDNPYTAAINLQNAFVDVAARVKPAVVSVFPETGELGIKEVIKHGVERLPQAIGSGFIVDSRGYLITNEHVVHGGVKFSVLLSDGSKYDGKVVGKDQLLDIALVQIVVPESEAGKQFPKVGLGDSEQVRPGMWAIALGNPIGFVFDDPEPVMTIGIVSGVHRTFAHTLEGGGEEMRTYGDLIQTDAAINPGNSGGPLLNIQGEVIGVNTLGAVIPGENRGNIGINFAVPINTVRRKIPLMAKGYGTKRDMVYGTINAQLVTLNEFQAKLLLVEGKRGVLVKSVEADGAAAKGGMQEKDVILGVNGRRVGNPAQLISLIAHMAIGEPVQFQVHRLITTENGNKPTALTLTVTLAGKTLREITAGSSGDEDN
jgi:serine protease Do